LNEDGFIVVFKLVSNDRREEIYNLLSELWKTPKREVLTECVYTDNPKVDSSFIQQAFDETKPKDSVEILTVLLDIFHAKSRITKELSRTHPDRKAAASDLSSIFAKLHHFNSYPTLPELKEAFENWCTKYSVVHAQLSYSMDQKIALIGKCITPSVYICRAIF